MVRGCVQGNAASLSAIDDALFVVALDYASVVGDNVARMAWGLHGVGGVEHRWYDKNFTLLVASDGATCVNFEHAPYDGATVVRLMEDVWAEVAGVPLPTGRSLPSPPVAQTTALNVTPQRLPFELSPRSTAAIQHATDKFCRFADITKLAFVDFTEFGKGEMKSWKMSPDGCIQMAYQLAYYRTVGCSVCRFGCTSDPTSSGGCSRPVVSEQFVLASE